MAEPQGGRGTPEVADPGQAQSGHARRVAESKATIPHIYVEGQPVAASGGTGELVRAAALALRDFPRLNAAYRDGRFELYPRVNVGVAVPAGEGFAYATIANADGTEPAEIEGKLERLAARAADGSITQPELSGATFALADLRPLGVARADLVVQRGQAAILSACRSGDETCLSVACDHRIVQVPDAAAFLARVGELVQA